MSDPEDRVRHLPRIVKSSVKSAVPRQEQLDNSNRSRTAAIKTATVHDARLRDPNRSKAAIKTSIGGPVLNNPNRGRVNPVSGGALNHHPPRAKAAIKPPVDGANNYNRVKTAIKPPIGGNAHPRDQELDKRPQSHIDHPPGKSANPESHVAPRPPRKVTFNVADFPLPLERSFTARNRFGQNAGRLNPGFASSGARESRASFPSKSASFFPERPSRARAGGRSTADVQRRGRGALSSNGALDQHYRTATKARQIRSHRHAESPLGKHARKFEGASGRPSLVPRMTSASRDNNQDNLIDSSSEHSGGSAFYINAGLTLARLRSDESSESSDSDSVEVVTDRVKVKEVVKAARKFQLGRKSKQAPHEKPPSVTPSSTQSSEQSGDDGPADLVAHEDSDELEYVDLDILHPNYAREQASSPSEPDVAEGDEAPPEMPSDALIEALEDLSLVTIRLASLHRLPFMLRNLRKGFLSRCKSLGIDTFRSFPPPKPITVVYSCAARVAEDRSPEQQVTRTTMRDWKCPFCELLGTFISQQILSAHLRWDHSNVGFVWDMLNYTLTLWLPLPELVPLPPSSRPLTTPTTRTASTEVSDFSSNKIFSDRNTTPATTQPTSRYTSVSSQSFHDPSLLGTKPKYLLPTPPRTSSVVSTNARSSTVSSRALSRASSTRTSGNPAPPPQSDPLGPAAQYPYLPESHSDGAYSCRLGGPRLYDLLNSMSLEPFGVLAWVILDREEEIFEIDDVRDEDKVMQALWFRWIFLNRNKFVANFFNGTKSFIKDNWRMIHQAAGLGALRTWLLCLNVNNFLVTPEVVTLLRFYRGLTGMKHWYDDTHTAQNEVAPV